MNEKIKELETRVRLVLKRIEELKIETLTYENIAKFQKLELRLDEINDLITWIEADQEF